MHCTHSISDDMHPHSSTLVHLRKYFNVCGGWLSKIIHLLPLACLNWNTIFHSLNNGLLSWELHLPISLHIFYQRSQPYYVHVIYDPFICKNCTLQQIQVNNLKMSPFIEPVQCNNVIVNTWMHCSTSDNVANGWRTLLLRVALLINGDNFVQRSFEISNLHGKQKIRQWN